MKLARSAKFNPVLFNIVPLVNVIFLLLLFFVLSKTFVLQPGMAVALPVSSFSLAPQQNPQIVSVKAGPVPTIFFNDQRMTLPELQQSLSTATSGKRNLIVRADKDAPYNLVVQVTDCALKNGYSVTLATMPAPTKNKAANDAANGDSNAANGDLSQ